MASNFEKLEKEVRALSFREKAALTRMLVEDLDPTVDENVEEMWIEEAQRRYEAYRAGNLKAVLGEEAIRRARKRLK